VLQRFEQKGLRIAAMKLVHASRSLAEQHYAVHKGKPFYDSLLAFLTSGPTLALVLEGREAVTVARNLIGATDGVKAPPGTIRGDFALSVQNNLIHGSDSPENAADEVALWFKPDELVSFQPVDNPWIAGA
jgi:nucleoside-diphosphate kinase